MTELVVQSNYFGFILKCLQIFGGLSIPEIGNTTYGLLYKIYATFIVVVCIFYYLLAETIDLLMHIDDLEYATFSLCYLINQGGGLLKGAVLLINRKTMQKYFETLESGYFLPNMERGGITEYKLINDAIRRCNFQAKIFYFFVITVVANRVIYALINVNSTHHHSDNGTVDAVKILPYQIYFPFDTNVYYKSAFAYMLFSVTIIGLYLGTCDALITGIMIHLKAQIVILKNSLQNITERACKACDWAVIDEESIEKVPEKVQEYVTKIVKDIVKHHQEIIMLVEYAEKEFNFVMLIQFLISLLLMCLQLFQLSLYDVTSPKFVSMSLYLVLMWFQLLMYCWNGNELALESLDLSRVVFESRWFKFNNDTQMALKAIIMRAQRPLQLSAGKFAFLSLETYTSILRGSASYYLALRKIREED